ncbi:hypothetical protein HK097_004568, partial [Rhizophlyctis rosea]
MDDINAVHQPKAKNQPQGQLAALLQTRVNWDFENNGVPSKDISRSNSAPPTQIMMPGMPRQQAGQDLPDDPTDLAADPRSDPDYAAYYYVHSRLDPRLPPPIYSPGQSWQLWAPPGGGQNVVGNGNVGGGVGKKGGDGNVSGGVQTPSPGKGGQEKFRGFVGGMEDEFGQGLDEDLTQDQDSTNVYNHSPRRMPLDPRMHPIMPSDPRLDPRHLSSSAPGSGGWTNGEMINAMRGHHNTTPGAADIAGSPSKRRNLVDLMGGDEFAGRGGSPSFASRRDGANGSSLEDGGEVEDLDEGRRMAAVLRDALERGDDGVAGGAGVGGQPQRSASTPPSHAHYGGAGGRGGAMHPGVGQGGVVDFGGQIPPEVLLSMRNMNISELQDQDDYEYPRMSQKPPKIATSMAYDGLYPDVRQARSAGGYLGGSSPPGAMSAMAAYGMPRSKEAEMLAALEMQRAGSSRGTQSAFPGPLPDPYALEFAQAKRAAAAAAAGGYGYNPAAAMGPAAFGMNGFPINPAAGGMTFPGMGGRANGAGGGGPMNEKKLRMLAQQQMLYREQMLRREYLAQMGGYG